MQLMRAKPKLHKREARKYHHQEAITGRLLEAGQMLLVEDAFTNVLDLERKRVERSHTPFLVMFLNVEAIVCAGDKETLLFEATSSLFRATREVDMKGWYERDTVIGIIFAEISEIGEQVKGKLVARVHHALCNHIGVELAKKVSISMHVFGKLEDDSKKNRTSFDRNLYPDLPAAETPLGIIRNKLGDVKRGQDYHETV
jgi:hypothetical protein